jgi:hypothetical protein
MKAMADPNKQREKCDGFLSVSRTEHQDNQKQGQKTQHLHQMGAVEWEQSCPEDAERSTQQSQTWQQLFGSERLLITKLLFKETARNGLEQMSCSVLIESSGQMHKTHQTMMLQPG